MDRDRYKHVPKPSEARAPKRPLQPVGAPKRIPMTPKKQVEEPDILDIWAKQDAIRAEDKRVEQKYKATKAKAKALKKKLKENDQDIPDDTMAINLSLPPMTKFKRPKFKVRKKGTVGKKLAIAGSLIGVLAIVGFSAAQVLPSKSKPTGQVQGATAMAQNPDFEIITSSTTPTQQVKFDGEKKVAQFPDKVGDQTVVVSQQQLPDNFKSDPESEVKKLAEGFSATDVLTTGGDQVAYLSTSAKGAQTVLLQKNGLLIFLFSTEPIAKDIWSNYIATLK